jgi:hypothetical protein
VAGYGVLRTLTSPDDPLRWLVPLAMALLPGYTDLMTSVNNDVAAVALFSFFIWGSVRLLLRGFSIPRLFWAGGTAALCLWTKSTVFLALPLFFLALFLVLFRAERRPWKWFALAVVVLAGLLASFSFRDAAYWYRSTAQGIPTRIATQRAVHGNYALQVQPAAQVTPSWLEPLAQPLPQATIRNLGGKTVTFGGWIWASEPVDTQVLTLHDGNMSFKMEGALTTEPNFFSETVMLPAGATRAWLSLDPAAAGENPNIKVYYDGLVLVEGAPPVDTSPMLLGSEGQAVAWAGDSFDNQLRNPSAESIWPSPRTWLDDMGARYLPEGSRPSFILFSLLDSSGAGWYYSSAGQNLLRTFWAKFGWGHVPLLGHKPYRSIALLTSFGLLGAGIVLWRKKFVLKGDTLLWFTLLILGVWSSTLTRGVTYIFVNRVFIPGARYASPSIIPTALILTTGWVELFRLAGRGLRVPSKMQHFVYIFVFLVLDFVSVFSIMMFFN